MNTSKTHRKTASEASRQRIGVFVRNDYGAAALEMAVSASVFLMCLFGAFKVCLAVYTYHYVAEAAREGARYLVVRGADCGTTFITDSSCPANTDGSTVTSYIQGLGYPAITTSLLTVTTTYSAYPSTTTCSGLCNSNGNMVTVKVKYAYPLSIPLFGSSTWNLSSTSSAIIAD
jgi:Flp pilus assembly protein TadG